MVTAHELLNPSGPGVAYAPIDAAIVEMSGTDVRAWANGMFTNNVRDLPVGRVQRSAMVDARGRVLGLLDVGCLSEVRFVAVLEGVDPDAFVERYDGYVFAEDVSFTIRSDLRGLTVQGPRSLTARTNLPAVEGGIVAHADGFVAWRDRTGLGGFDVFGSSLPQLSVPEADPDAFEALRVLARRVRWPIDFGGTSLPHEMGMRAEFLSFEKGCYIGQEAIHRIDVQGQVRRHLALVRLDVLAPHGAEVRLGDKVVGVLTSPVLGPDGPMGLAVVREPAHVPGTEVVVGGVRAVVA